MQKPNLFASSFVNGIADKNNDSCAINPVYSKDPQYYRENDMIYADVCRLADNNIYVQPIELESLLSSFYFNANDFLTNIYNLYSFDDVIYWTLENDQLPFYTIKRVHNCAWKVFGQNQLNYQIMCLTTITKLQKNIG